MRRRAVAAALAVAASVAIAASGCAGSDGESKALEGAGTEPVVARGDGTRTALLERVELARHEGTTASSSSFATLSPATGSST